MLNKLFKGFLRYKGSSAEEECKLCRECQHSCPAEASSLSSLPYLFLSSVALCIT